MGMSTTTRVRAIRLANALWDKIEIEAEGREETVNAVVARRLDISFKRIPEERKTSCEEQKELDGPFIPAEDEN